MVIYVKERKHMNNQKLGIIGENAACEFLEAKGYMVSERNYRCSAGEIDIIAHKNSRICFIEVKTRRGNNYGRPCEAVNKKKRKNMINTAQYYIKSQEYMGRFYEKFEFQVIEVMFEHIEDIF